MEIRYNLYNLEASFKNYLFAGNKSSVTVKNYLSDLRHFLGWLIFKLKAQNPNVKTEESVINFIQFISSSLITEYHDYLVENRIPEKTIKRRLSTLRKFCSYCINQGWMKENLAKQVKSSKLKVQSYNSKLKAEDLLSQFEKDLIKEKIDQPIITSYLNDVQEFLNL